MKTVVTLCLSLLVAGHASAQNIQPAPIRHPIATRVALDSLAKADLLTGMSTGFGGLRPSRHYPYYEVISKQATTRELIEFTKHPNPVVKCYAFMALMGRELHSIYPLINYYRDDNTIVFYQDGCLVDRFRLRDFFMVVALHFKKLTPKEAEYVKTLLPKDFNYGSIPFYLL